MIVLTPLRYKTVIWIWDFHKNMAKMDDLLDSYTTTHDASTGWLEW